MAMTPDEIYPVRWSGRQALVALPEDIDVSNAGQIREELLSVINLGAEALIVDMTATMSCDHAGADAVARAYQRAVVSRTELRLVVTSGVVLRMLGMTGVGRLVPVYPSVEAALAARSPAASAVLTPADASKASNRRRSRPGLTLAPGPGRQGPAAVMPPGVLWNMIEAFNDGVALADGEGTLVLASRRLEKMFGYQHTELAGQPLERLIPAHLQAARARPVGTGVLLTGLRQDGTTFPVEISLSPVPTATARFSLVVVRDMTAVRSLADLDAAADAAEQVRRSQDLLDMVITRLYQVGVSLQPADLSRDTARPHIEEALRTLDDIISQIRDSTFADTEDQGH
jgi:anti-anti-sigma factor